MLSVGPSLLLQPLHLFHFSSMFKITYLYLFAHDDYISPRCHCLVRKYDTLVIDNKNISHCRSVLLS